MGNLEQIIGIDLCEGVSQLSCFDMEKMEPGGEREIPTLLLRTPDGGWLAGEEAGHCLEAGEGVPVQGFLTDLEEEPELEAGGERYAKADLIALFLREILAIRPEEDAKDMAVSFPGYLTVTAPEITPALCRALLDARETCGAQEQKFSVMSHRLSAEFFALSQKRELWMHDVGIFEYDESGLRYEHLSISGTKHPAVVRAQMKDLRSFLDGSELDGEGEKDRDEAFIKAIAAAAGDGHISTFYLVGRGFRDVGEGSSWMKRSLQELCAKRRHVFVGQNFYVKGACYNSYYMAIPQARPEFVAADTELTASEVFIYITQRGKMARLPLIPAQTPWFTAAGEAAVLPDGTDEITVGIQSVLLGETRRYPVLLDQLPERPPKTTKLLVRAEFQTEAMLHICVQDLGFGEIFPATGKTWEKEIDLAAENPAGTVSSVSAQIGRQVLETALPGSTGPFQIPRTGTRVYAFDELCWYIRENITALDPDFFEESLFAWLDRLSGSSSFSDSLRRMKEDGRPMSDLVRFLFGASDYISPAQQKETASVLAVLEKQDGAARAGMVGDYYYRYGRYMSAALQYQHAIWLAGHDRQEQTTRSFRAGLWHNLALALLRLGDRQSAVQCLQRAFQEHEDAALINECLSVYYMSGEEEAFRELAQKHSLPESVTAGIRENCDRAGEEYGASARAAALEEMLEKPGREGLQEYAMAIRNRFAI